MQNLPQLSKSSTSLEPTKTEISGLVTWMSMEVIVTIVSKLAYNLLKGLTPYLYRGEITQLLSTMDIPVVRFELVSLGKTQVPC